MKKSYLLFVVFKIVYSAALLATEPESRIDNDTAYQDFSREEQILGYLFSREIILDSCYNFALYNTLFDWLGTQYRYAGENREGVDCSGFTTLLYKEAYGIQLNGGSYDIINQVDFTFRDKGQLKEGDLLFFKIHKKRISHVGVYLGNGKFAHSSSRAGVVISDLNDPYYQKYFFKAGRFNINN